MENEDAGSLLEKGNKLCDSEKYKKAIEEYYAEDTRDCYYESCETYIELGNELYNRAKIEQNKSLLKEAFDKYNEAAQLELGVNWPFVVWGNKLYELAKIEQDESLFQEAFDKYDKAGKVDYDEFISIKQGIILVNLAEIKKDKSLYKKATESFRETEKSILEISAYFDKEETELIIKTGVLYPLLLNLDTEDGKFFNEATKNINDISQKDKYKEIYIRSVFIISQLHINREYEKNVAHYTKKIIAHELLLHNSKFRLNAIKNSNDPTEGKIILDYLFKNKPFEEEKTDTEYRAFAGCFTFKHDNLNLFRLYGKDNDKEGTGLSLIFHEDFFCRGLKMPTEKDGQKRQISNMLLDIKDEKYTLFRCVYIDQKERQVKAVGQSEITNEKYKEYIEDVFHIVYEKMEKLKDLITQNPDLNQNVIEHLLLNLRYLTKHIAFKEEQECRIVRICSINERGKIHFDKEKMFIEYESDVIPRIEKVYFGPKATNMELFKDRLKIELNRKIKCKKSENPLA